jgi:hypothetical protein
MRRKAKAAGIRSGNEKVFRSGRHAGSFQGEAEIVATRDPSIRLPDYSIAGRGEKLELRIALSLYKTVLDIQCREGREVGPFDGAQGEPFDVAQGGHAQYCAAIFMSGILLRIKHKKLKTRCGGRVYGEFYTPDCCGCGRPSGGERGCFAGKTGFSGPSAERFVEWLNRFACLIAGRHDGFLFKGSSRLKFSR